MLVLASILQTIEVPDQGEPRDIVWTGWRLSQGAQLVSRCHAYSLAGLQIAGLRPQFVFVSWLLSSFLLPLQRANVQDASSTYMEAPWLAGFGLVVISLTEKFL